MAQTKFKLNVEHDDAITHAHIQKEPSREKNTPIDIKGIPLLSGIDLSVHLIKLFEILSPTQKKQLVEYAKLNDKTASCVIKEVLISQGIIENDN